MRPYRELARPAACSELRSRAIMLLAVLGAGEDNSMARGWLRRKKGSTLFCWRNSEGIERSRSLGSADMSDKEAWAKVGELKLNKLVAQADPLHITFGELAEKYLATYPFKKQSTKELHEQVIRNVLLPAWSEVQAAKINAQRLKSWFLSLDIG